MWAPMSFPLWSTRKGASRRNDKSARRGVKKRAWLVSFMVLWTTRSGKRTSELSLTLVKWSFEPSVLSELLSIEVTSHWELYTSANAFNNKAVQLWWTAPGIYGCLQPAVSVSAQWSKQVRWGLWHQYPPAWLTFSFFLFVLWMEIWGHVC